MRRITFVLALICLCFSHRVCADDVAWIDVATPDEFAAAIRNNTTNEVSSVNIRLTADIDMSKIEPQGGAYFFSITFSGKITGAGSENGHNVSYILKNADRSIFVSLANAEISNLYVSNSKFTGRDDGSGMIANEAEYSSIHDVIFSKITATGDADSYDCDRMGCAVGTATSCTFTNLGFLNCELITDGWKLGLVAGETEDCTFDGCITNAACQLWADGSSYLGADPNAYVGGICGYATGGTISNCTNYATVMSDDDCTGGILGYGDGVTVTGCNNGGAVRSCTKAGFGREIRQTVANYALAIGATASAAAIATSILSGKTPDSQLITTDEYDNMVIDLRGIEELTGGSTQKVMQTITESLPAAFSSVAAVSYMISLVLYQYNQLDTPDYMGGIAGYAENGCSFLKCTNQGPLQCGDSYCGGIVGWLDSSTIKSCYNRAFVKTAKNYVGGIVGKCKTSSVQNCLNTSTASSFTGTKGGGIEGEYTDDCTNSGNYMLAEKAGTAATCTAFTQDQLASGCVALQLNNALTTANETAIWRQNLGTDFAPTLCDNTKSIVATTTTNYNLVQNITTAGDFFFAVTNPWAQISLQNDIDMANSFFMLSTEAYPFKGTINGNGHTIANFSYESSSTDNNTTSADDCGNNIALFPWASNATFQNFTLDNCHITQKDETNKGYVKTVAFLTGTSKNCTYNGITIRNSTIPLNADKDLRIEVGSFVANSTNDVITDCSTTSDCRLEGCTGTFFNVNNTYVGGIAGIANGTTFTRCHNAATVWANDNDEGGICGYIEGGNFNSCLNTGSITGQRKVAGIVGAAVNTSIAKCVNTGTIDDDENTAEDYRAGIVAEITADSENGSSVNNCLNFGTINNAGDYSGTTLGYYNTNTAHSNNSSYCQYNGETINTTSYTPAQIMSGEFTYDYNHTSGHASDPLYQDIDLFTFDTHYPVPIPAAGTVKANYTCDGSILAYSNIYNGSESHSASSVDKFGLCTICGSIKNVPNSIEVSSAAELKQFAYATNRGQNFSNSTIQLTTDIDMTDITDYAPVGSESSHPFSGTFDGQGYRIKNLTFKRDKMDGVGIFGCVTGNSTEIKNLIVDSSCSFDGGASKGVAGLVGYTTSEDGTTCSITIENCGNEADIKGNSNVAGILGGVYGNTATNIAINNCYNLGTIKGTSESATLCGYAGRNYTFANCYNCGGLTGADGTSYFHRYTDADGSTHSVSNCYDINGGDNTTKITANQVRSGELCSKLNASSTVFTQKLGTDTYPVPDNAGLFYDRATATGKYGTICLPSTFTVDGATVYSATYNQEENSVELAEVTTPVAGMPYIYQATADAQKFTLSGSVLTTPVAASALTGVFAATAVPVGSYVMQTKEDAQAFYPVQSGSQPTLSAYKAYLTVPGNPVKAISIGLEEDEEAAINSLTPTLPTGEGVIYNLAGQRVGKLQKGVNIVNGIKVLVK